MDHGVLVINRRPKTMFLEHLTNISSAKILKKMHFKVVFKNN